MSVWRKDFGLQMVMYHAVIKTKESNLGVAPYAVWGEATPYAIAAIRDAARSCRRENTDSVDVEVALSGEGKDVIVHELERMGRECCSPAAPESGHTMRRQRNRTAP